MTFEYALSRIKLAFKEMITYKVELIMHTIRAPLFLLTSYFVWKAIFTNTGQAVIRGFTFNQMFTYYVLVYLIGFVVGTNVDSQIAYKIKKGTLTKDLIWPRNFIVARLYTTLGTRFFLLILPIIPAFLVMTLLFDLTMVSGLGLLILAVAAILGFLLSFFLTFLFGISAFWLKDYEGFKYFRWGLGLVLAGSFFPLSLLPDAIRRIVEVLPFAYTRYKIVQIGMGQLSVIESLTVLAIQAVWIIVFILLCRYLWSKGIRHYQGVGA